MYGAGIFETLRFDDGIIHFAEEHLSRLRTSSQKLGMNVPYSDDRIVAYLQDLIGKQKIVSGVAKINLMCEREAALLIITTRENHYTEAQYQKGFRIKLSEYKRNEYSKWLVLNRIITMKTYWSSDLRNGKAGMKYCF
jgi:4-amino-4-deoxychorismate lyase